MTTGRILTQFRALKSHNQSGFAVLADPDKIAPADMQYLGRLCNEAKVDYLFMGGSLLMAHQMEIPRYALTEHGLQIGLHCIATATQDPQNRQMLQRHLVEGHLLGDPATEKQSFLQAFVPDMAPRIIQLTTKIRDLDQQLDYFLGGASVKLKMTERTAGVRKSCEGLRSAIEALGDLVGVTLPQAENATAASAGKSDTAIESNIEKEQI